MLSQHHFEFTILIYTSLSFLIAFSILPASNSFQVYPTPIFHFKHPILPSPCQQIHFADGKKHKSATNLHGNPFSTIIASSTPKPSTTEPSFRSAINAVSLILSKFVNPIFGGGLLAGGLHAITGL